MIGTVGWRSVATVVVGVAALAIIAVLVVLMRPAGPAAVPSPFLDGATPATATVTGPDAGGARTAGAAGLPVRGAVAGLAPDDVVWMVVVPVDPRAGEGYTPAPDRCAVAEDGAFDCGVVIVGGAADIGRTFEVQVLRVTEAAANAFIERRAGGGGDGAALADLPPGVQVLTTLAVDRVAG